MPAAKAREGKRRSSSRSGTPSPQRPSVADDLAVRAEACGIDTEYRDAWGRRRRVGRETLARLLDVLSCESSKRLLPPSLVLRQGRPERLRLAGARRGAVTWEVTWQVTAGGKEVARGESRTPDLPLPPDLPVGTFDLHITVSDHRGERKERATLLVAPERAWQGDGQRLWLLALQLYSVRSRRNWGYGDFTDLAALIDLAAQLGAAGIGLNPLHALLGASPYSPNSRLFLNPLYIDVEAIPEFPGLQAAGLKREVEDLRRQDLIDYERTTRVKMRGLELAYAAFLERASAPRRDAFAAFRAERSATLHRFACFELLRRRQRRPWWEWPEEWRAPNDAALDQLRRAHARDVGFFEFVQWSAHEQLVHCRDRAQELRLPLGLYLDVAIGVPPDAFDAWNDQGAIVPGVGIGAPPDLLNTAGQNWGLAGVDPMGLERACFTPFRHVLQGAMRYAGAIRLDHVLGLKRLYLIPEGMPASAGAYIRLPFTALLAVVAQESAACRCIVIGEDLGTVPENFRETLSDWGIWSYQVMLFERDAKGNFQPPEKYRAGALATFSTHDLPTFAGWVARHDLEVKRGLGIDPGETAAERKSAIAAIRRALFARGLRAIEFAAAAKFLAAAPSRLVAVAIEDALGIEDQVNVPGTLDEHPNWRRRLPVSLEQIRDKGLAQLADAMAAASRSAARGD